MMQLETLLTIFVPGALQLFMCVQSIPLEAVYTGDSCDCPRKLNYFVNMPQPPMTADYVPNDYGYKLDCPLPAKAKVTYSFDFDVEQPMTPPPPPPEAKLDLYAKIDRIMAHKEDCLSAVEVPKTCGCFNTNTYATPESNAARFTRTSSQANGRDDMATMSSPTIMAILLEPLPPSAQRSVKSRSKRGLSRIFMRPRTNVKRSDRMIKQYSKSLQEPANERAFLEDTQKPITTRAIRPLHQLSRILNLPALRNKRDIKGEYDLIEKEREQMDLTLPEITQYMPETLDPNFKRNQCLFGQNCQRDGVPTSTSKAPSAYTSGGETSTFIATTESADAKEGATTVTETDITNKQEQNNTNNSINLAHTKRNTDDYSGGCPVVLKNQNPTPNPSFTYESLRSLGAIPRPSSAVNYPSKHDPLPQQYVGAYQTPFSPTIIDNTLMETGSTEPTGLSISNSQLDRIIAAIVNKNSDFIYPSSQRVGALVDPAQVQDEQAKYFLKSLKAASWNDWLGEHYHHKH